MRLDPTVMRNMGARDFRVLEAVERGMKDHYLVPMAVVTATANLRRGGTHKIVSGLLRDKLLSHENRQRSGGGRVDGYRLTNAGYDVLALHHLKRRKVVAALGQRIGTGKESDVYLAASPSGRQIVLKFHRLGRTSFRNVRQKRDYLKRGANEAHSWLFLSRLSALKEYAFMKALHGVSYPTPTPLGHDRHVVCMSLVRGVPLYQIYPSQLSEPQAIDLYRQSVALLSKLARHGLVHCDLNEFNLLVDLSGVQSIAADDAEDAYVRHSGQSVVTGSRLSHAGTLSKPAWEQSLEAGDRIDDDELEPAARLDNGQPKPVVTLIDFPQMISTSHPNGREYFERDVRCIRRFFEQKLHLNVPDDDPLVAQHTRWDRLVAGDDAASNDGDDESGSDSSDHRRHPDENRPKEGSSSSSRQLSFRQRLDRELRASGYSKQAYDSHLELYYFQSGPQKIASAILEEEEEEEEQGEEDAFGGSDEDEQDADSDAEEEEIRRGGEEEEEEADAVDCEDKESSNSVHQDEVGLSNSVHQDEVGSKGQEKDAAEDDTVKNNDASDHNITFDTGGTPNKQQQAPAGIGIGTIDTTALEDATRKELEDMARARVQKQLEQQKRRSKKQGAYRKHNSNKTFVKGKRVVSEAMG